MIKIVLVSAVAAALCGQSLAAGVVPRDAGFGYHFGGDKDGDHGAAHGQAPPVKHHK